MHMTVRAFFFLAALVPTIGCEDSASSGGDRGGVSQSDGEATLVGTLALDGDATKVANQKVEVHNGLDEVLATGVADAEGNFEVAIPGQIALAASTPALRLADARAQLTLSSLIEDDGQGKVLGVKEPLDLEGKGGGRVNLGSFAFAEVAAIKGKVRFIDQGGVENTKTALLGTDVYLPGYSIYAKTDKEGSFLLLYVPAGDYTLRIEKASYAVERSISVQANTTLNLGTIDVQTDTVAPMTTSSKDSTDFRTPMCVALSSDEPGSKIYYTTDGSTPTATAPFLYTAENLACGDEQCPICIQEKSTTLKFFAVDSSGNAENQQTKFFFHNPRWSDPEDETPPVVKLYVNGEEATGTEHYVTGVATTLTFTTSEASDVFYTVDGSAPTPASRLYTGAINLLASSVVKFFARDYASNQSGIGTKDVRIYDWHPVTSTGTPPTTLMDLIYDDQRDSVVGITPAGGTCIASDIDTWSFSAGAWTQVANDTIDSCARGVAFHPDTDDYYLFVYPTGSSGSPLKAYKFDFINNEWDFVADSANLAIGVELIAAVYDEALDVFVLTYMSGGAGTAYFMTFNPTGPAFSASATATTKAICDLAYDKARGKVIGYGKCSAMGSVTGSVFEYDGTWTEVEPIANAPGNRIAYDVFRDRIVTFGAGYPSLDGPREAWQYDGTDWQLFTSIHAPQARTNPLIVYDSTAKRTLIFGGKNPFNIGLSDLWEYRY